MVKLSICAVSLHWHCIIDWLQVRNCSTLLLSALMTRIFGVNRSKENSPISRKNWYNIHNLCTRRQTNKHRNVNGNKKQLKKSAYYIFKIKWQYYAHNVLNLWIYILLHTTNLKWIFCLYFQFDRENIFPQVSITVQVFVRAACYGHRWHGVKSSFCLQLHCYLSWLTLSKLIYLFSFIYNIHLD